MSSNKNSLPVIGIPGRAFRIEGNETYEVFAVGQDYVRAVVDVGGLPLPIPPIAKDGFVTIDALYERCDGFLFPGGEDINPRFYKEEPHPALGTTSGDRDACEFHLMIRAREDRKPVFGICRGFQLANVVCGGSLYQDIPSQGEEFCRHPMTGLREIGHKLSILPQTRLYSALQVAEIGANSLHHQGVKVIGQGLKAVAFAEDGFIEGLEAIDPNLVFSWFAVSSRNSVGRSGESLAKMF